MRELYGHERSALVACIRVRAYESKSESAGRRLLNVIPTEVLWRELVLMGRTFRIWSLRQSTFPTRFALPVRKRRRGPRPDRKLFSMSLFLGIIVLRLRGPPYIPGASY